VQSLEFKSQYLKKEPFWEIEEIIAEKNLQKTGQRIEVRKDYKK
jgi:hypothetical protein